MKRPSNNREWAAGWTLAPPLHTLFRETTSPLSAVLSPRPGSLTLSSPDSAFELNLDVPPECTCYTSANGLRLTCSFADKDEIASLIMLDPSSLLVEADEPLLKKLLSHPGFERSVDEAYFFQDEDQHRLAILADIHTAPMRVAVVAGTGSGETMRVRARSLLAHSAHSLIDAERKEHPLDGEQPAAYAREFIKSRMHAATGRIPYPWPTGSEGEPIWNFSHLYPVFVSFLDEQREIAAGLINNLLEMTRDDGSVPVAGGCIGQPIYGCPGMPLLATMCAVYHKSTGTLPADGTFLSETLSRYMTAVLAEHAESSTPLIQYELRGLRYIAHVTDRLGSREVKELLQNHLVKETKPLENNEEAFAPLLQMIASERRVLAHDTTLSQTAEKARARAEVHDDEAGELPCLILLAGYVYRIADYRSYSAWIEHIFQTAVDRWNRLAPTTDHAVALAYAGLVSKTCALKDMAFGKNKLREQRVYQAVEKYKKALFTAGAVLILGFAAFIFSVLMRQTMPISVYETNVGMVLQYYKNERFEDALVKISEIENRGGAENLNVRFLKGKALFKMGEYGKALEDFDFCIEKRPENPAPYYNRAMCFFRLEDFEKAAGLFRDIEDQFRATHPSVAVYARQAKELAYKAVQETQ